MDQGVSTVAEDENFGFEGYEVMSIMSRRQPIEGFNDLSNMNRTV